MVLRGRGFCAAVCAAPVPRASHSERRRARQIKRGGAWRSGTHLGVNDIAPYRRWLAHLGGIARCLRRTGAAMALSGQKPAIMALMRYTGDHDTARTFILRSRLSTSVLPFGACYTTHRRDYLCRQIW